jgi:hypothetical protein
MPVNPAYLEALAAQAAEARKRLLERKMNAANNVSPEPATKRTLDQILAEQRTAREAKELASSKEIVVPSTETLKQAYLASAVGAIAWNDKQSSSASRDDHSF